MVTVETTLSQAVLSMPPFVKCVEQTVRHVNRNPSVPSTTHVYTNRAEESPRGRCRPPGEVHDTSAHPTLCRRTSTSEMRVIETLSYCSIQKQAQMKIKPGPCTRAPDGAVPAKETTGKQESLLTRRGGVGAAISVTYGQNKMAKLPKASLGDDCKAGGYRTSLGMKGSHFCPL